MFVTGLRLALPAKLSTSQERLLILLDQLRITLDTRKSKWFDWLFHPDIIKGCYIHGGVGQGKTMLMDNFYSTVQAPKCRMHFHNFMLQIQEQLHVQKQYGLHRDVVMDNILDTIFSQTKLLCLDEFHVDHISDAMILVAIFERLFRVRFPIEFSVIYYLYVYRSVLYWFVHQIGHLKICIIMV